MDYPLGDFSGIANFPKNLEFSIIVFWPQMVRINWNVLYWQAAGENKSPKPKYFGCWVGEHKVFIPKKSDIRPKPKDFGCWVGENNVIALQVIAPWDLEV